MCNDHGRSRKCTSRLIYKKYEQCYAKINEKNETYDASSSINVCKRRKKIRAAADNHRHTSPPRHCRHSGVKLPLRCRCRHRHLQQSSCVVSHCPSANFLPPVRPPHPTLPVDGRPLFSQRADCDQTPSPASRWSSVVLSALSLIHI